MDAVRFVRVAVILPLVLIAGCAATGPVLAAAGQGGIPTRSISIRHRSSPRSSTSAGHRPLRRCSARPACRSRQPTSSPKVYLPAAGQPAARTACQRTQTRSPSVRVAADIRRDRLAACRRNSRARAAEAGCRPVARLALRRGHRLRPRNAGFPAAFGHGATAGDAGREVPRELGPRRPLGAWRAAAGRAAGGSRRRPLRRSSGCARGRRAHRRGDRRVPGCRGRVAGGRVAQAGARQCGATRAISPRRSASTAGHRARRPTTWRSATTSPSYCSPWAARARRGTRPAGGASCWAGPSTRPRSQRPPREVEASGDDGPGCPSERRGHTRRHDAEGPGRRHLSRVAALVPQPVRRRRGPRRDPCARLRPLVAAALEPPCRCRAEAEMEHRRRWSADENLPED